MQTSFYVSGFIYNLRTRQILLIQSGQSKDMPSFWSTFGGDSKEGEETEEAFQRVISKLLNIEMRTKDIHPVYDYFHETRNKTNYVFYAEVRTAKIFNGFAKDNLSWFAFSEIGKLPLTSQMKQDIIVGERVINAKNRDNEARKLFNSLKP